MQPDDRVKFGGLCFACSVFLSRARRGFSLSSVVPFMAHRGRRIHPFARLLFRFMVQRTRHIDMDVLVLQFCQSQRLIWRRSESYNVLLSYNENKINKYKIYKEKANYYNI